MKINYILFSLLLGCLTVTAQDGGGFDFTEEEAAADAQLAKQQELQALIGNASQYEAATHEAYAMVVNAIAGCCNQLKGHKDLVDCSNYPDAATLHKESQEKLLANYPYDTSSGQFTESVLSRVMLSKAKPNMTGEQVTRVEHMITRAEAIMRWFIGPFRFLCGLHNHDFQKEVQRVARFVEYSKTEEFKVSDKAYAALAQFFGGDSVPNRSTTAVNSFGYNDQQAYVFYNHFHNRISDQERESWINYILMGSSLRHQYDGPILNLSHDVKLSTGTLVRMYVDVRGMRPCLAASEPATKLAAYMNTFKRWHENRLNDVAGLGKNAFEQLHDTIGHSTFNRLDTLAGETLVKEDADFKHAVNTAIPNGLQALLEKDDLLMGLTDYLKDNTHYVDNVRQEAKDSLMSLVQRRVEQADRALSEISLKADKTVPRDHPSRQRD